MEGTENGEGVLRTIGRQRDQLSAKERIVADYILQNPQESVDPGIADLSDRIGISESTLVRFAKKLGFSGYQQFRIALAREAVPPLRQVFETDLSGRQDTVDTVFRFAAMTVEETRRHIDRVAFERAVDLLVSCRILYLGGLGGSNVVALDACHKLMRTGIVCSHAQDFHLQLMAASQACGDDAALLVSHTGFDSDAAVLAEEYRSGGCPVIALTGRPHSPFTAHADVVLSVTTPKTQNAAVAESFSSRTAATVVIDALYVEVMARLGASGLDHVNAMRNAIAKRRG